MAMFTDRIAAKRQTAGIKFSHRPKVSILTPQGRLVALIHVKLGVTEGHMSPLGCAKFHANRCLGVGKWPQWQMANIYTFLVKSRPAGANPLADFYNCWVILYAKLPCISVSVLHLK